MVPHNFTNFINIIFFFAKKCTLLLHIDIFTHVDKAFKPGYSGDMTSEQQPTRLDKKNEASKKSNDSQATPPNQTKSHNTDKMEHKRKRNIDDSNANQQYFNRILLSADGKVRTLADVLQENMTILYLVKESKLLKEQIVDLGKARADTVLVQLVATVLHVNTSLQCRSTLKKPISQLHPHMTLVSALFTTLLLLGKHYLPT